MLRNRATETRGGRKKPNFQEKIRFLLNESLAWIETIHRACTTFLFKFANGGKVH